MEHPRVVIGEKAAETRAIQLLSIALEQAASWTSEHVTQPQRSYVVPPLMQSASQATSLATIYGPETPLEIIALSARNMFETFIRLKYILLSDANCQQWRNEAVTDQLQIYEGIISIGGQPGAEKTLRKEMARVRKHAESKRLSPEEKILSARKLARETGLEDEYVAFYKLYSKLVHPSSFTVNWPKAAATPIFRTALILNLQVYGQLILDELQRVFGLPVDTILGEAHRIYGQALNRNSTRPNN